jgi:4-amino-4-deoxy-L-arabinose transferase-like glycosyltransferase
MLDRRATQRLLLFFAFSIFCLLVCHNILTVGRNGDGVHYAAVARNMAQGWGTFWAPYLSETFFKVHYEHPPLVYWIQSLFFRLLGDSPYVEGIYGFIIGVLILCGTAACWQQVHRHVQARGVGSWWPLLLLISLPVISYVVQSNLLVVTFLVLALFATLFSYLSLVSKRLWLLHACLSGILVYLGGLAKGPVALFSLAVPAMGYVTFKTPWPKAAISTAMALATCAVLFLGTLYLFPESQTFWQSFWREQVVASLTSARGPRHTHFLYVERWLAEMAVPFALVGLLLLLTRMSVRRFRFNRQAAFFLGLTLAGALPFFVSQRQHLRYILHAMPFFILSLASATEALAESIEVRLAHLSGWRLRLRAAAILLMVLALGAMVYRTGAITNREAFFRDLYNREDVVLPERIMVSVYPETMIYDDLLMTDMQRFFKVSVTAEMGHDYLLMAKNSDYHVPPAYQKVHQKPTEKYMLYKKVR